MYGAIASAASGVLSSLMSNSSAQESLKAQREENVLNRKFNSAEAQKSRDFQRQMFDAENAYNDPKRVVSRLMSAGLNPALAFGNFADSASVSGGSSASYGNGVNPAMPDWSGIHSAGRAALENEMIQAQIRLADAQAGKFNAETNWVDKVNQSIVNLNNSGFDLNISKANLTDSQAKLIEPTIKKLETEISNLKTQGEISKEQLKQAFSDTRIKEIEAKYKESDEVSRIQQQFASAHLSEEQAIRVSTLLSYEVRESLSRIAVNNSTSNLQNFQFHLNEAMKTLAGLGGLADKQLQIIESTINSAFVGNRVAQQNADTNSRNAEVNEFNSFMSVFTSMLSLGQQAMAPAPVHTHNTNIYNRSN